MKTYLKRILLGVLLFGVITGFSAQYKSERRVVLPANEIHEGWFFAAGSEVVIDGTVNGDLYAAGGIVEINGTVKGDVLAAGGQVVINGIVTEDARVTGAVIRIEGAVQGNCTAAAGTVTLARSGSVGANLLAAGGSVRISGLVAHQALVSAGEMTVGGTIGEDLRFYGDEISVYEGAEVKKDLHLFVKDSSKTDIAPGTVKGSVTTHIVDEGIPKVGPFRIVGRIFYSLMLIATALVIVLLFPGHVRSAGTMMFRSTGRTILWGIVGLIVVPVASVLAMVTVIGLPLGILVLLLYAWFIFLSQLSFPVLFWELIGGEDDARGWKLFWPIAVGVVIVQLVMVVPYIRLLVFLAGMILGIGVLVILIARGLQTTTRQ
ncbi:MAG TPA: polymer-forming cytoskeletal protein [Bacteroidota bacterium]|nr:polymer-forming cytoskeletal protein [Bacteroidota bacterium]